jgi:hypothetical protein
MRGVNGRPGWFYLFIIEGAFTVGVAVCSYLYLPASPTNTKNVLWGNKPWYTERQEKIMVNRGEWSRSSWQSDCGCTHSL